MFNPSQLTIGELGSAVKDYGIFFSAIYAVWKLRGAVQPAIDLFKKASAFFDKADEQIAKGNAFMMSMEKNMDTLLNNHLSHLKTADDSKKSE